MSQPGKIRVRQSFERAATTYDDAAEVQRRICRRLAGSLPTGPLGRVLDAGCGTGYALKLLHPHDPSAELLALDFSPAMLARSGAGCRRLAGDLEQLPLTGACIDLYWSSLAVQWCDLGHILREARRVLKPEGRMLLATLGPATFRELRHAFAGVDRFAHTLGFHAAHDVENLAAASGFTRITITTATEMAHYDDFPSLLRAVKAVGANQLGNDRRPGLMSRGTFARAALAAESLRTVSGLPLTYDVIILDAQP